MPIVCVAHAVVTLACWGSVASQALDATGRYIAVGGEGCQTQLWDLDTQTQVFKAKGGKPNKVGTDMNTHARTHIALRHRGAYVAERGCMDVLRFVLSLLCSGWQCGLATHHSCYLHTLG